MTLRQPTENEIQAARKAVQPYWKQVNETPALMSLLYDIDLMPEQIHLRINAMRMIAVCELFKMIPLGAFPSPPTEGETNG